MIKSAIALIAAAFIGLAATADTASARPGGGGFHGGFHGGGFRGGYGGFRRFGPGLGIGLGLGLAGAYPYYAGYGYNSCLVPRRIWTPYGWRVRLVNICYAYY